MTSTGAHPTTPATPNLREGDRIGGARILRVLGRSGQGATYLAQHEELGPVAVKECRSAAGDEGPADLAPAADRQPDEAAASELAALLEVGHALTAVVHPHLARVHRCIERQGTPYLIMEHVEGPSLQRLLARGGGPGGGTPWSEQRLRALLSGVLGGLDALHGAGVLHRDVKPANILYRAEDEPVLVDFDAALPLGSAAPSPSRTLITPGYAAPEQYVRDGNEGPWTDLYGVAAVGYRIITGVPPTDALARVRGGEFVPVADAGRGRYSLRLLAAIDQALDLNPSKRPQSAQAWMAELDSRPEWPEDEPEPARTAIPNETSVGHRPAPAATPTKGADEGDDGPPTVPVRRVRPATTEATDTAATREPPVPAPARRRVSRWLWLAAALLLLAALPPAASWGWTYYLTHIKSEWTVDAGGGGDVETIAEAMATAKEGAVIKVRPGSYAENLVMNRPVTLQSDGGGADHVVVVATGKAPCLAITAATGTVNGLGFRGEPAADPATELPAGPATDPAAAPAAGPDVACVEIDSTSAVALTGNAVSSRSGPALRIHGSAAPTVRGNRFGGTPGAAVVIEDEARGTFAANAIVASGGVGLLIRDNAAPLVSQNRIEDAGQAGILVTGNAGGRLADNEIVGSARSGLEVGGRSDPAVVGNRIIGAEQAGIYVYDDGRGLFEANAIADSGFSGVIVGPGGSPVMTGNAISDNKQHGILVLARGRGRYQNNTITDNGGHGLALDVDAAAEQGENALAGNREPQVIVGEAPDPATRDADHAADPTAGAGPLPGAPATEQTEPGPAPEAEDEAKAGDAP